MQSPLKSQQKSQPMDTKRLPFTNQWVKWMTVTQQRDTEFLSELQINALCNLDLVYNL
jgi:hypothetical protein